MNHLTREELERWWSEGLASERERVLAHLASCDRCGALYAEVLEARPLETREAPPDLVARAHRMVRRKRPRTVNRFVLASAAAAALIVALALPFWRSSRPDATPSPDTIRGTSLSPLAPLGEVRGPLRFRWASPFVADRYAVEVRDESGELVFVLRTTSEEAEAPPELFAETERGETYSWEVVAYGPEGEEMLRSPSRSFRLGGSDP